MTPIKFLGIIERDGEAPILAVISELHVTPMKRPGGRPKATAKHVALVMAFGFELLRLEAATTTVDGLYPIDDKRVLWKAREAAAKRFGYKDDREVRRLINSKNPLRGANGKWVITMGVAGSGELVIVTEHTDAVVLTEATIHVDGRGWVWRPGMTDAAYGRLRASGILTARDTGTPR